MKTIRILIGPLTILMMGAIAQSQQRTTEPPQQRTTEPQAGKTPGQYPPEVLRQIEGLISGANGLEAKRQVRWITGDSFAGGSAWWTNTALVTRLGLTDDQKTRVERAFENHRQSLTTNTEQLTKEENQLQKLLEADPIDRNAILTQIDRVIQARGELERTNSAMTLEMREILTRAQWMQLPQNAGPAFYFRTGETGSPLIVAPGVRGGGGRGAPGQRSGGGQRQQ
jgi:Spy/CpxP family protein refolding chaperone